MASSAPIAGVKEAKDQPQDLTDKSENTTSASLDELSNHIGCNDDQNQIKSNPSYPPDERRRSKSANGATEEEPRRDEEGTNSVEEEKKDDEERGTYVQSIPPPLRRSRRDTHSIKLRGTAPTFYRRLHTLFFSDSTLKAEYEDLLRSPGHRKRGRNSKLSSTEASTSTRTLLKLAEGPVVASSSLSSSAVLASTLQDLPLPVKPTEGELQGWLDIRKNQWRTTKNNTVDENDNKRIQCPAPSPVPLPLSPSPPVVSLSSLSGDVKVERVTRPDEAAIFVVDNFLTENELLYFDERIRGRSLRFERSFVDNMEWNVKENEEEDVVEEEGEEGAGDEEDGDEEGEEDPDGSEDNDEIDKEEDYGKANKKRRIVLDTTHRTSTFVSFRKMQDSKIATLEQRIADMFGCFVPQIEPLQMVRYTPGQFFGVHHDMGEILPDDTAVTPPKSIFVKRRLVTIFIYLNTLDQEQGGATLFPKCNNLRVRPERGRAVIWSNVTSNGQADSRTIHAGEPVIAVPSKDAASQCKYGINVWICEE